MAPFINIPALKSWMQRLFEGCISSSKYGKLSLK